jgi:hypothetical protein
MRFYALKQRITFMGNIGKMLPRYPACAKPVLRQVLRIVLARVYLTERLFWVGKVINCPQGKNAQVAIKYGLRHKKAGLKTPENREEGLNKPNPGNGKAIPYRVAHYQNIVHYLRVPSYTAKISLTSLKKNVYGGSIALKLENAQYFWRLQCKSAKNCHLGASGALQFGTVLALAERGNLC